jgi:multimeric flavodoxin WrbA
MNVLIISTSPNHDGLTAACGSAAQAGVLQAGGNSEVITLNDLKVGNCQACDRGWGTCQKEHTCQVEDDFQALHKKVLEADALVLVTPVYWGEMSESAKALTDRLRRCEATRGSESGFAGRAPKPVIAVAAAGGSGGGMITCLASMERWIDHIQARKWDLIPVNRWSRPYKLETIRLAAETLVRCGGQIST